MSMFSPAEALHLDHASFLEIENFPHRQPTPIQLHVESTTMSPRYAISSRAVMCKDRRYCFRLMVSWLIDPPP